MDIPFFTDVGFLAAFLVGLLGGAAGAGEGKGCGEFESTEHEEEVFEKHDGGEEWKNWALLMVFILRRGANGKAKQGTI